MKAGMRRQEDVDKSMRSCERRFRAVRVPSPLERCSCALGGISAGRWPAGVRPPLRAVSRACLEVHAPRIYLIEQERAITPAIPTVDGAQEHSMTGRSVPPAPCLSIPARIYTRWKMWTT